MEQTSAETALSKYFIDRSLSHYGKQEENLFIVF